MRLRDYDPFSEPYVAISALLFGLIGFFVERDTKGAFDKLQLWGLAGRSAGSEAFNRWVVRCYLIALYLGVLWHFCSSAMNKSLVPESAGILRDYETVDYDLFGSPPAALLLLVFGLAAFFIERDTKGIGDRLGLWGIGGYTPDSERTTFWASRLVLLSVYLNLLWHFVRQIVIQYYAR